MLETRLFLLGFSILFLLNGFAYSYGALDECDAAYHVLMEPSSQVSVPMGQWMLRAAQGDEKARELLGSVLPFHIRNMAITISKKRNFTMSESRLDDVVQMAMIAIAKNNFNYDPELSQFGTWIFGITQNAMTAEYRTATKDKAVRFSDMSREDDERVDGTIRQMEESESRHESADVEMSQVKEAALLLRSRDAIYLKLVFLEGRPARELEPILNESHTTLTEISKGLVEKIRHRLQILKIGVPDLAKVKIGELSEIERDIFLSIVFDEMPPAKARQSLKLSPAQFEKHFESLSKKLQLPAEWSTDSDFLKNPVNVLDHIAEMAEQAALPAQPAKEGVRTAYWANRWKTERPLALDKAARDVVRFLERNGRYPQGGAELQEITGFSDRKLLGKDNYSKHHPHGQFAVAESPEAFRELWNAKRLQRIEILKGQLATNPNQPELATALANLERMVPLPQSEGLWQRTLRKEVLQAQNWSEKVPAIRQDALEKFIGYLGIHGKLPDSVEALREITGWPEDKLLGRDQYAEDQAQGKNAIFKSSADFKEQWTRRLAEVIADLQMIDQPDAATSQLLTNLTAIKPTTSVEGIKEKKPHFSPTKMTAEQAEQKRAQERESAVTSIVTFIAEQGRFPENEKEASKAIGIPFDRLLGQKRFADGKERESTRVFASPEKFKEAWTAAREQEILRLQNLPGRSEKEEKHLRNLLANPPNRSRTGYSPGMGNYRRDP